MCAELIGTAFADRLYKKEYEMIQENILELVKYGLSTGLVDPEDKVYTINRLLELFQVDEIEDAVFEKVENLPAWTQEEAEGKLEGILAEMMDYAYENGLMAETVLYTKICLIQKLWDVWYRNQAVSARRSVICMSIPHRLPQRIIFTN